MVSEHEKQRFFVVSKGEINSRYDTEFLRAEGSSFGPAPQCESCGRFIGMKVWLSPFRVELVLHGSEWADFAFFGLADFLLSERASKSSLSAGLVGLSGFEHVEVLSARGSQEPPPEYRHVSIARSSASVDEERSSVIRSEDPVCEVCLSADIDAIHGFALRLETWTGEDVFFARGLPGIVIASDRFRTLADEHSFTNVRFIPTESYEWDP
jgi:hypothetical protein